MALTEKLTNIGNAIREKTGKTELLTLDEMPKEIQGISGGGSDSNAVLLSFVDRTATSITADDLKGLTGIGYDAIENFKNLTYIEIPETVEYIDSYGIASNPKLKNFIVPENTLRISSQAFGQQETADYVKFMWKTIPQNYPSGVFSYQVNFAKKYLVRGSLYDDLMNLNGWSALTLRTEPFDEYVKSLTNKNSLFNTTTSITVNLQNYTSIPVYSITSSNESIVSVSNMVATTDTITFDITSHEIEGAATINVDVNGAEDYVFHKKFTVTVFEKMEASTYEVVQAEGSQYGFVLNKDGYYESQNQKIPNSYAICRVNIHNPVGRIMYLDCINYAETNYDYGMIGKKDTQLQRSNNENDDNLFYNFQGKSQQAVQTVADNEVVGDCFIEIKYRKDSSGDLNNDSLQFKIRFEN